MKYPSGWFQPPPRFRPFYIMPGTRVGTYVIRECIGQGGGQVAYLAESSDGRQVVVKMSLYPKGHEGTAFRQQHERFLRQVTFFLQLRGIPGIAHVWAHDMYPDASESGYAYMVQEYVQGSVNFLDWYAAAPHPLKAVVAGFVFLANACGEMDRRGICNRDLKPQNILVTPRGTPKIVDFDSGMAAGAEPLTSTGAGRWPGTRRYYAPEVCRAILAFHQSWERTPYHYRPAADLHALGVLFYEVLTGQYPFVESEDADELYESIAHDVPKRPRAVNPEIPFGLDKVTMRLLRKEPERRHESGDEVAAELEALLDTGEDWERPFQTPATKREPSSSPTGTTRPRTPRTWPRLGYWGGAPDSAARQPAPMAIVLAGPRALAVRGPRAIVRVVPAPSALVAPAHVESAEPTPGHLAWRRPVLLLAALLCLAFVVPWLSLGQRGSAGSFFERGTTLLGKAKAAMIAAASTVLAACGGIKVRTKEKEWLATCSPEARRNFAELGSLSDSADASLLEGPNVLILDYGIEVRDGPVEAWAFIQTPVEGISGVLYGDIRTGADGASIRLTSFRERLPGQKRDQPPRGPEIKVCAIAYLTGYENEPGIPKVESPPREKVELHPGFTHVWTREFNALFAH